MDLLLLYKIRGVKYDMTLIVRFENQNTKTCEYAGFSCENSILLVKDAIIQEFALLFLEWSLRLGKDVNLQEFHRLLKF
jgi:hypothetical protein